MAWKTAFWIAVENTCRDLGNPWAPAVLRVVGVVGVGVLAIAAAARAWSGV